jgi:hypothetical protein
MFVLYGLGMSVVRGSWTVPDISKAMVCLNLPRQNPDSGRHEVGGMQKETGGIEEETDILEFDR